MDPNATLYLINAYCMDRMNPDVDVWCENLRDWINRGGFEPSWTQYPLGSSYYRFFTEAS